MTSAKEPIKFDTKVQNPLFTLGSESKAKPKTEAKVKEETKDQPKPIESKSKPVESKVKLISKQITFGAASENQ